MNIGINHIGFQADDVIKTYNEIRSKGVQFNGEPYRNKHTGWGDVRFRDPDDWRLQLSDKKRQEPEKRIAEESVVGNL